MNIIPIKPYYQTRSQLLARLTEAQRQYKILHSQVLEKQARLQWSDEVRNILVELNEKEHEREVGTFEKLLTSCLEDVLPGYREVVMDLGTFNGLPALDIYIKKGPQLPLEDALDGTGQSVTNILSLGLRAISIMRSGKRRFMILDEADCWVKEEYAPKFTNLVNQLSIGLGFQILMISHKPEDVFEKIPHIVRLEKHSDGLAANWIPTSEIPIWEDGQKGLRSIFLENFMAHTATFLPLSPGLTVLFGDNDIGKSAIVTALRAVFLGSGKENDIQHYKNSCQISLNFGPENYLQWTRFRKGKVKENYKLLNSEHQEIKSTDSAKTPDWVESMFKIGLIDDLDIQLRNQSDPIFLLNKPATNRAKALSIGNDGGHVQTMMALDKVEVSEAKLFVKQGEKRLEYLRRIIHALSPLAKNQLQWDEIEETHENIEKNQQRIMELEELAISWKESLKSKNILEKIVINPIFDAPQKSNQTKELLQLHSKWNEADLTLKAIGPINEEKFPEKLIYNNELVQLQETYGRWKIAAKTYDILKGIKSNQINIPTLNDNKNELIQLLTKWQENRRQSIDSETKLINLKEELETMTHLSAICNKCGQIWSPEHLDE